MKNELTSKLGFFDPFFEDFFGKEYKRGANSEMMRTNIKDEGDHYLFEIELPSVKKENIKVSVEDGYLTIVAEYNNNDSEKNNGKYIRRERYYGTTSRSFYVGDAINENDIEAKLDNGILNLSVKKVEEKKPEKRYIEIQ